MQIYATLLHMEMPRDRAHGTTVSYPRLPAHDPGFVLTVTSPADPIPVSYPPDPDRTAF